jgi:hypothetical protein
MVEQQKGNNAATPEWDAVRRNSIEIDVSTGSAKEYAYSAYPLMIPYKFYDQALQLYIAGGGDNPLLMGGLAIATFSLEASLNISSHSFNYAKLLLGFIEDSEAKDHNGNPTGFLVRKRHFWRTSDQASIDELCGLLIGLLFFYRAAKQLCDSAAEQRVVALTRRLASFLKKNEYMLEAPNAPGTGDPAEIRGSDAFIFQFPYGRVFKEITGDSYRMGSTFPSGWWSPLTEIGLFLRYLVDAILHLDFSGYSPKDLFKDGLYHFPWVYNLARKNFYNLTMYTYCVLMVIVPDAVQASVKKEIAHEANDFFKKLCYDHGAFDFIVPDGYHNALFGVVAKKCAEIEGETDTQWLDHIEKMIEFLRSPKDLWFRDLPLGVPKDTAPPGRFEVVNTKGEFLWGEWYAWTKKGHKDGPSYSFTNAPEWDFDSARSRIGPGSRQQVEGVTAADLSAVYTPDLTQGFRLEASGLDFLFARILASFFGYVAAPNLANDAQFSVLPVEGPVGDGYLANKNTGEVHDLSSITSRCFISKIKPEHQRWFKGLDEAYAARYDACHYCLKRTHVGRQAGSSADRFLGNRNSREVHDLMTLTRACNVDKMKPENRIFYATLPEANADGFDNCRYCLGGSQR